MGGGGVDALGIALLKSYQQYIYSAGVGGCRDHHPLLLCVKRLSARLCEALFCTIV